MVSALYENGFILIVQGHIQRAIRIKKMLVNTSRVHMTASSTRGLVFSVLFTRFLLLFSRRFYRYSLSLVYFFFPFFLTVSRIADCVAILFCSFLQCMISKSIPHFFRYIYYSLKNIRFETKQHNEFFFLFY